MNEPNTRGADPCPFLIAYTGTGRSYQCQRTIGHRGLQRAEDGATTVEWSGTSGGTVDPQ